MGEVALPSRSKIGWMVNAEAAQGQMVEGQCNLNKDVDTITGLAKMYLWWTPKSIKVETKKLTEDGVVSTSQKKDPNHQRSVTFWTPLCVLMIVIFYEK
jgi:hypothetical protein